MSFINYLLKIDWSSPKPLYNIRNTTGLELFTRLRLGLSNLNEHKFNHNFRDCKFFISLILYSLEVESSSQIFLHCH